MRKEVLDWLNAAEDDLNTAGILLEQGVFYASAFYSQQASEKALKGVYIYKFKKIALRHNIIGLASELNAPEKIVSACKKLNPHYVQSRYPDAANALPAESYDEEIAEELLAEAREVFKWSEKKTQE
ncbi:MAG: HEPN domain-containing protein [archaeon]|nr:HEPN domain-containing protein [archaeon]